MKNRNFKLILTALLCTSALFFVDGQKQAINKKIDPLNETREHTMVKGTVTTFNHFYVMNAEVTAKKSRTMAFTDSLGNFEILVPGGDVLCFKANGFQNNRKEVSANEGDINMNMVLKKGKKNIEKAVTFGHLNEHDLAYAFEHYISYNHDVHMYSDLRGLIQAKLLDATVTDQGSIKVYVRGKDSSPFGSSQNNGAAIFVLDGMFVSDIDYLNPWDIKTIRLLKGSEATMIYGSRGVNGVVLISTKHI